MEIRKNTMALLATLLLGAFAFMSGCATTGMDRSVKASNSIQDVDKEIRKLIVQIDVTNISLDTLMNSATPDLKKNFDAYSDNVNKLDKQGKLEMKRMDEMKLRSKEYFAEWEKQGNTYTNSEIRELSEERRNELAAIYAQVPEAAVGVRGALFDYVKDLKEIQMYLSNDLTPKGIETITPVVDKTKLHMETLKSSFRPVIKALDEIKSELYIKKK
jgi:chaperonin cofactor prefoldin